MKNKFQINKNYLSYVNFISAIALPLNLWVSTFGKKAFNFVNITFNRYFIIENGIKNQIAKPITIPLMIPGG